MPTKTKTMNDRNFYQQLKHRLTKEAVVVATIVKTIGSAPREVGAKMAICADGSIIGTIGGGAGEGKVIQEALQVFKTDRKQLIEIDLTGAPGKDIQGICGGKVQIWLEKWSGKNAIALTEQILKLFESGQSAKLITSLTEDIQPYLISNLQYEQTAVCPYAFSETIQPPPALLIIGGGHVALALAQIASFAGFEIAVQDDRPEFTTPQRFPQAAFLTQSLDGALARFATYQQLYIALVTRGLTQDVNALNAILQCRITYQYIGAIGSQKRIRAIKRAIPNIALTKLPNFYAPIGLDIGALTPEEIAVSICGELIKVRRGGTGLSLCDRVQHSRSTKVHIGELLYAKS